ncbi:Sulfur carrier protein TusA [Candidatus Lokiarchaeum ossiferum]|uniref:Sulfur carrier protein TusA n=1 Tax=Candidatus Lokiarchaeum ossiferum TaxID=2951803 RepID=A0ABY6HL08_9ARCH|nr:Sulfur carrier protein TusA [Candidatus Lokiarchaeum sp. B-35]
MTNEINPTQSLDCIGFFCPEPLFQTRQEIDGLEIGDVLEVLADDPAAEEDIARFCKRTGHQLLELEKIGKEFRFLIKKTK